MSISHVLYVTVSSGDQASHNILDSVTYHHQISAFQITIDKFVMKS